MPVELTSQQEAGHKHSSGRAQLEQPAVSTPAVVSSPMAPAVVSQGMKARHATVTTANLQINQAMGTKHGLLSSAGNTKIQREGMFSG